MENRSDCDFKISVLYHNCPLFKVEFQLGGDIEVLVSGSKSEGIAKQAAQLPEVKKVMFAQDAALGAQLPERVAVVALALQKARNYSHVLAGSSAWGRSLVHIYFCIISLFINSQLFILRFRGLVPC